MEFKQKDINRFWSKVDKKSDDECWKWLAGKTDRGYGTFRLGKMWRSHRLSYTLTKGDIPEGMVIMHTCDTADCVNPSHLLLGTIQDNVKDMTSKGRHKNQIKEVCLNGHSLLDINNVLLAPNGGRWCRKCKNIRTKEWKIRTNYKKEYGR